MKSASNNDHKDPFSKEGGGLFRAIFEQAPVGVAIAGREQQFLYVNSALCRMLGYEMDELLRLSIIEVVHPDERAVALATISGMIANPVAGYAARRRWLRKDGTIVPVTVTTAPICGPDGAALYGLGIIHEDSARQKAEDELRESEGRLRAVFESSRDAIGVSKNGVHIFANPAYLQLFGFKNNEEIVGKSILESVALSHREEMKEKVRQRAEGEEIPRFYEARGRKADGTEFDAEFSISTYKLDNEIYSVACTRDITERNKAEKALRRSEEHYRLLFQSINDAVFVHGVVDNRAPGRFFEVNDIACKQLGYSRKELLKLDPAAIDAPETRANAAEVFSRLMADRHVVWEGVHIHKDGRRIPVEMSANLFDYDGRLTVVTTARDITERKHAAQKQREFEVHIQEAQKLESLGILAGGIAHDFNNLLTVILGHANLALMDLTPESPARDNLREIDKASGRAAELCRQMLAYAGKGRFVMETVNLSRLIEESAHLLQVSLSKKVMLRCQLDEALPAIEADPAQLRQVVMNLVINAAEAIDNAEGFITLSTSTVLCDKDHPLAGQVIKPPVSGRYVCLEVADTGCGMDAKTTARIFDPFFTTKFAGRGLGLAALLGIVRSHNGGVTVESEPGRGTTFRILIPVSTKAVAAAQSGEASPSWRGKGTILLVDDEELVRFVTGQMLEYCGFNVLPAGDGREALNLFRAHASEIVCVLLDLAMPHMDGQETFRELRLIQPDVRVVLATGYSDQEVAKRFSNAGLNGFIAKPYRLESLGAKLREVLAPGG
jgi:PAS domain S-box-containing protein